MERSITSHDARSSLWSGIIRRFLASNDAVSSTASLSTTANSSTLASSSPVPSRLHFVVTTVTNAGTILTSLHRLIDDTNSETISISLHRLSDFAASVERLPPWDSSALRRPCRHQGSRESNLRQKRGVKIRESREQSEAEAGS